MNGLIILDFIGIAVLLIWGFVLFLIEVFTIGGDD